MADENSFSSDIGLSGIVSPSHRNGEDGQSPFTTEVRVSIPLGLTSLSLVCFWFEMIVRPGSGLVSSDRGDSGGEGNGAVGGGFGEAQILL